VTIALIPNIASARKLDRGQVKVQIVNSFFFTQKITTNADSPRLDDI